MVAHEKCTATTLQAEYGGKLCIVTYIIVTTYFPAYSRAQNMQIYCLGRIFFISLGIIVTMAASVIVFPRCASDLGYGAFLFHSLGFSVPRSEIVRASFKSHAADDFYCHRPECAS